MLEHLAEVLHFSTRSSAGLGHSLEGKSLLNDAVVQYIKTVGGEFVIEAIVIS